MSSFLRLRVSRVCFIVIIAITGTRAISSKHFQAEEERESGRIINGTISEGLSFFMVSIGMYNKSGIFQHLCGGTIWDERTILTAAHCLYWGDGELITDAWTLRAYIAHPDWSFIYDPYVFHVKSVTPHPHYYYARSPLNDIGIVTLASKIDMHGNHSAAKCICDPEPLSAVNTTSCIILGWGLTNITLSEIPSERFKSSNLSPHLLEANVSIHSDTYCTFYAARYRHERSLCAGPDASGGGRICYGDSGGPLICTYKAYPKIWTQVGVISHGWGLGCNNGPSFFTRVYFYRHWLEKMAAEALKPTLSVAGPMDTLVHLIACIILIASAATAGTLMCKIREQGKHKPEEAMEMVTPSSPKPTTSRRTLTPTKKQNKSKPPSPGAK